MNKIAAIVLAAGLGTRFNDGKPSRVAKVLLPLAGKPMISYTLSLLEEIGCRPIIIVVGYLSTQIKRTLGGKFRYAIQPETLGTGHAAAYGLKEVPKGVSNVLIINGDDSAFYEIDTIRDFIKNHLESRATISIVTLDKKDPTGYGRVVRGERRTVERIVEEKVATDTERKIKEVNDGVYLVDRGWLGRTLPKIKKSAAGEYYLVDLVEIANKDRKKAVAFKLTDPSEWFGINSPAELKEADALMRKKLEVGR